MCTRPELFRFSGLRQAGVSLVELIMFIVIVSIAVTGILLVMNKVTAHSADALIHKQSLAIAESLLEEVELMPFTICDPNDPNAASAVTAADCTGGAGGPNDEAKLPLGPETAASVGGAEGRYAAPQFDNVNDYNGFTMAAGAGIRDITNSVIPGLNGYGAQITVQQAALGAIPNTQSLLITVVVTGPDGFKVQLDGYRTRYAPNSP
jgi:MSHA pilin protein MshD